MTNYETAIVAAMTESMQLAPEHVSHSDSFFDQDIDSLTALRMCRSLSERLGQEIDPEWIYEHACVTALAAHLTARFGQPGVSAPAPSL